MSRLQLKAVTDHLTRMMKDPMEEIHTRLDRVQEDQQKQSDSRNEGSSKKGKSDEDDYYSHKSGSSKSSHRRPRRARETSGRFDDNLGGMKLKIPTFYGKNDPDAYLEWEKKIELVFDCQHFSETKKVRLAATEFTDYAINWWDQVVTNRRRTGETPVNTWQEMKFLMRKRFVPGHYHRDLHQKIRKLAQGNSSVEDYFQEIETLMMKVDIDEDPEATMSRFLGGLNKEIHDRLEMQDYGTMEEMLHKAILVEKQLKRSGSSRNAFGEKTSSMRTSYPKENSNLNLTNHLPFSKKKVRLNLLLPEIVTFNVLNVREKVTWQRNVQTEEQW